MDKIWKFHKVDGKIKFYEQQLLSEHLKTLNDGEAIFRPLRKNRSLNQNDYYWGVVLSLLEKETGNDQDAIHEFIKDRFLSKRQVEFNGQEFVVSGSTRKLTTAEFEELMEKVRAWAQIDLNINIPLPNEVEL